MGLVPACRQVVRAGFSFPLQLGVFFAAGCVVMLVLVVATAAGPKHSCPDPCCWPVGGSPVPPLAGCCFCCVCFQTGRCQLVHVSLYLGTCVVRCVAVFITSSASLLLLLMACRHVVFDATSLCST